MALFSAAKFGLAAVDFEAALRLLRGQPPELVDPTLTAELEEALAFSKGQDQAKDMFSKMKAKQSSKKPASGAKKTTTPAQRTELRQLNGIINSMPGPGAAAPRDYVILGAHDTWSSAPVTLQLASGEEHAVVKETYDYMVRGLTLADSSVGATVMCEDGTSIACMVAVESVC